MHNKFEHTAQKFTLHSITYAIVNQPLGYYKLCTVEPGHLWTEKNVHFQGWKFTLHTNQEYQGSDVVQCVSFSPLQKGSTYDSEFASSALLSRLQDEDPAVVSAVLGLGEKVSHHWLVQCGAGAGGEGASSLVSELGLGKKVSHHWLVQCGAGAGGEGESHQW